jgi:hypothetical protein
VKISRRQFLALALGTIGTGVGVALGVTQFTRETVAFDNAMGKLDDRTLDTLHALAATYVGPHGAVSHYRAYFAWRAENLPGYLTTYRVFATSLDAAALNLTGSVFTEADETTRQEIMHYALELPNPDSSLYAPVYPETPPEAPPSLGLEERLWQRFHSLVIAEVVYVFLQTNAWIMLGYLNWPGQPRGLEQYTQPITGGEIVNGG